MPSKPPAELIKFLKPYDRAIQKLCLDLRKIVIAELAPCHENIYDAYSAVAIGYFRASDSAIVFVTLQFMRAA